MDITIDSTEFEKFGEVIAKAPDILEEELTTALDRSGKRVVAYAVPAAPHDRGGLRASITDQVTFPETKIGSNLIYAPVHEDGRTPGAKMPPVSAIAAWLSRKGGNPKNAYVVARAIGKKGITGKKFLKKGLQQARPEIHEEFRQAIIRTINRAMP